MVSLPRLKPASAGLDALLSARRLRALLDCSDRTLRRWIQAGRIPKPVRIGRQGTKLSENKEVLAQ